MTCKNCGEPIAKCELGPDEQEDCYYHPGSGWHRCDGKPEDTPAPVAEPAPAEVAP